MYMYSLLSMLELARPNFNTSNINIVPIPDTIEGNEFLAWRNKGFLS